MLRLPLRLKIAQKPFKIGSLGPKTSKYESLPKGSNVVPFSVVCNL